jgi:hypothetical protein
MNGRKRHDARLKARVSVYASMALVLMVVSGCGLDLGGSLALAQLDARIRRNAGIHCHVEATQPHHSPPTARDPRNYSINTGARDIPCASAEPGGGTGSGKFDAELPAQGH